MDVSRILEPDSLLNHTVYDFDNLVTQETTGSHPLDKESDISTDCCDTESTYNFQPLEGAILVPTDVQPDVKDINEVKDINSLIFKATYESCNLRKAIQVRYIMSVNVE